MRIHGPIAACLIFSASSSQADSTEQAEAITLVHGTNLRPLASRPLLYGAAAGLAFESVLRVFLVGSSAPTSGPVSPPPPITGPPGTALPPARRPRPIAFAEIGLGAQLVDGVAPRATIGASVYPRDMPASLGAALEAHVSADRWAIGGILSPVLRAALAIGSQSAIELGAGPGLVLRTFRGVAADTIDVRVDPALHTTLALELRTRTLALAVVAAADVQQHVVYKTGDATVLDVSPFSLSMLLRLRFGGI